VGTHAALDVTTWLSGYDLTGDSNQTATAIEYDALVDTRFGMRGQSRIAGLESVNTSVNGYVSFGTGEVDDVLTAGLTGAHPLSQSPDGTEGSVAWFWQARTFMYQVGGALGEVLPFSLSAQSGRSNGTRHPGAVRGRVLKTNAATVSATGATGTAYQLGAVPSGRYLYAALHTFAAGTTVTAVLESAADNTFAGATTRMTFGPITAVGGTWGTRVAGPITDTWYRLRITAVTGTFTLACVAGIK
jgi:hypothetical protein